MVALNVGPTEVEMKEKKDRVDDLTSKTLLKKVL